MKIVIDTNIVFSAILTPTGKIDLMLTRKMPNIIYIAPYYLLDELQHHTEKILKITKYDRIQYEELRNIVIRHIHFVEAAEIHEDNYADALKDISDIDEKDTPFLALAYQEDTFLWTGDKKLINGLRDNKRAKLITTDILYSQYF